MLRDVILADDLGIETHVLTGYLELDEVERVDAQELLPNGRFKRAVLCFVSDEAAARFAQGLAARSNRPARIVRTTDV